jgi:hypothetical protein
LDAGFKSLRAGLPAGVFFTGDLSFNAYCWEKKSYLVDFSLKFNEIKFCFLLLNWLMMMMIIIIIIIIT